MRGAEVEWNVCLYINFLGNYVVVYLILWYPLGYTHV